MAQQTKHKDNDHSRRDRDKEAKNPGQDGGIAGTAQAVAEQATKAVGSGMESMARQVDQQGPQEGMMGSASTMLADTLEQAGQYLQKEGFTGMAEDVTGLFKRYPWTAVGVGLTLGFLLGCCPVSSRS